MRSVAVRDEIARFEGCLSSGPLDPARFTRREYLALSLAWSLADNPFRVTDEQMAELKTEFTDAEIIEMIFACAIFSWGNIIGIATRVQASADGAYGCNQDYRDGHRRKVRERGKGPGH